MLYKKTYIETILTSSHHGLFSSSYKVHFSFRKVSCDVWHVTHRIKRETPLLTSLEH